MIYGLYLSAQGAQIQSLRQEVVANNLANAATNAFKRDLVRVQANDPFDSAQGRPTWAQNGFDQMPGGVSPAEIATDFSQGELVQTKGTFDLALSGKGFLQVADGKRKLLTRDGQFALNTQNQLVTREQGLPVLTASGSSLGPIDPLLPIEFRADGVVAQGDTEVGRLAIIEPQSYQDLQKLGKNMYTTAGKIVPAAPDVIVKQGWLETSGVRPVAGMMELIESSRALEANVNMIRHQDEALGRLLQSLPRK